MKKSEFRIKIQEEAQKKILMAIFNTQIKSR